MKKLKVMMMTLMMCLVSVSVLGQEIFTKTSGTLKKATGWQYNDIYNQWVSHQNLISDNIGTSTSYLKSRSSLNFVSIQTKSFCYNNIKYYAIIIVRLNGQYKYQYIQQDWFTYKTTSLYVFSEKEYKKLYNITDSIITLKTNFRIYEPVGTFDDDYVTMHKIIEKLKKNPNVDDVEKKSKYDTTEPNIFEVKMVKPSIIHFTTPYVYFINKNMNINSAYFETSLKDFNKIIIK